MRCIAVERPQDLAKPGAGRIKVESDIKLVGLGTKFTSEIMSGDMIKLSGTEIPELVVDKVISENELTLKAPGVKDHEESKEYSFKITPKLD